jgi:hypothetical protein
VNDYCYEKLHSSLLFFLFSYLTIAQVFTLFLDTVTELVTCYREDVGDWLYILLTRLLSKMGGDLLSSVVGKINRLLDLIRDSFPAEAQFGVLMRYLGDVTQTPNSKVKLATLTYLRRLLGQGQSSTTYRYDARENKVEWQRFVFYFFWLTFICKRSTRRC